MSSQLGLTVSLVMAALFAIAILGFSIDFANDNNSYQTIYTDPSVQSLNDTIGRRVGNFSLESDQTLKSIVNSTAGEGSDVVKSPAAFSITWSNVFGLTKDIFDVGYKKIFGSDNSFAIYLTTFFGLIAFAYALYIIKTWRGSP